MFFFKDSLKFQVIWRNIFKPRKAFVALEYAFNIQSLIAGSKCCSKCEYKVGHPVQRKTPVT